MICILSGVPIWFTIGILVTYAPEFAKSFDIADPILTAKAIMYCYLGFVIGDFGSGLVSQIIKSRNKAVKIFIAANFVIVILYLFAMKGASSTVLYGMCSLLGLTGGYWAVIVTMSAEQFGTNMRATVATAVPNFIRFALVPMSLCFLALKAHFGLVISALVIGTTVSVVAFISVYFLNDSYGKDLNYIEHV
jgi:putative MFS transporter